MKKQIVSMKRGAQKGFTLIELMIVVAIIAILSAFALPAYQDYTIRTRVAEGLNLASSAKVAVTEYYTNFKDWPANNTDAGLAVPSKITGNGVESVTVKGSGVIEVKYKSNVDGSDNLVQFSPDTTTPDPGQSIVWTCSAPSTNGVKKQYLPAECR